MDDIVDEFWQVEMLLGYEVALKVISERYGLPRLEVDKLVIADDELNNGNT